MARPLPSSVSRASLLRGRLFARVESEPPDAADAPKIAAFAGTCLSARGVECRICGDHCEPRAIRFRLLGRGRSVPTLDAAACDGCGACVAPCPVGAIALTPVPEETAACA
ncbi:4Fe-4S dicluster domain-containing protein [Azospirillum thermophilum]|uniref:4Fe-4S ferredoxin-type domain-containing protein n=1 Tax=Azospirillum thermophilum TaxID=2202148 RepID=A0A2S2CYP4_9PROT|nr:4Fe-4S dicluster domain-containing protein [Azospirillum thermophilum]AWK89545.1 hypothetical protein DEW08_26370 [Azospirillum thermophilum]